MYVSAKVGAEFAIIICDVILSPQGDGGNRHMKAFDVIGLQFLPGIAMMYIPTVVSLVGNRC
jgi:hypothetical protein